MKYWINYTVVIANLTGAIFSGPRPCAREKEDEEGEKQVGVWNEWCLFITNYLNGSDFGGPAGRLTSKWRVRRSQ